MKKKLFIVLVVIMSVIITVFAGLLNNLFNTYGAYKGEVPGTGFIVQELMGAGSNIYDVDSEGKIYFVSDTNAILIYGNDGKYLYTLPLDFGQGQTLFVKINDNDNIMVYSPKAEIEKTYNSKGLFIRTISDRDLDSEYIISDDRIKSNGIRYYYNFGIITKTENRQTKVIFTVPEWQKEVTLYTTILIIAVSALFIFIISKFINVHRFLNAEGKQVDHIELTLHLK